MWYGELGDGVGEMSENWLDEEALKTATERAARWKRAAKVYRTRWLQMAGLHEDAMARAEKADLGKYYVKARVYGAIANHFRIALESIAKPGSTGVTLLAKEALEWRHSVHGGVPMSAVKAIGALLNVPARWKRAAKVYRAGVKLQKNRADNLQQCFDLTCEQIAEMCAFVGADPELPQDAWTLRNELVKLTARVAELEEAMVTKACSPFAELDE